MIRSCLVASAFAAVAGTGAVSLGQTLHFAEFRNGDFGYVSGQTNQLTSGQPTAQLDGATLLLKPVTGSSGLLRFDDLFGAAPEQIPSEATIRRASLLLYLTAADADTIVTVHDVLHDYSPATVTSSSFGAGGLTIDAVPALGDDYGAAVAASVVSSAGYYQFDVTDSLEAWLSSTSAVPAFYLTSASLGNASATFAASGSGDLLNEFGDTIVSPRPMLSVQYYAAVPEPATLGCILIIGTLMVRRPHRIR